MIKEYTNIDALEALKDLLNNQQISKQEFEAINKLIDEGQMTPNEVCLAFIPYRKSISSRHK